MLNGVHDVDLEPPSLVEAPPAIVPVWVWARLQSCP